MDPESSGLQPLHVVGDCRLVHQSTAPSCGAPRCNDGPKGACCVTHNLDGETIMGTSGTASLREPWNRGKIVGQKAPFKLQEIWALRVRLQLDCRVRELPSLALPA